MNSSRQSQPPIPDYKEICSAIKTQSAEKLQALIKKMKADVNYTDENDGTLLHIAAGYGRLNAMKALMSLGSIYREDKNGEFPIHRAAEFNHPAIVDFLINVAKQDINQTTENESKFTPLHTAAKHGNLAVAKILIELKAKHRPADDGQYPIHVAARFGQVNILLFLIKKVGINCDLPTRRIKNTPLHIAAVFNRLEAIKTLLKLGATHRVNKDGEYPIHLASQSGRPEIIDYFVEIRQIDINLPTEDNVKDTPLHLASEYGQLEAAKKIFALDGTHLANQAGDFPLHLAAHHGYRKLIIFFIKDRNINVNLQNAADGNTPLHIATENEDLETVRLLKTLGATHLANKEGIYPLHRTAYSENPVALIRFLVKEMKADINVAFSMFNSSYTTLDAATLAENHAAVKELIRLKATISKTSFNSVHDAEMLDLLLSNTSTEFVLKNFDSLMKSMMLFKDSKRLIACLLAHHHAIGYLGIVEGQYMQSKHRGYTEITHVVTAYKTLQPFFATKKQFGFFQLPKDVNDLILKFLAPAELKTLPHEIHAASRPSSVPAKEFTNIADQRAHFFSKLNAQYVPAAKTSEVLVVMQGNKRYIVDSRYLQEVKNNDEKRGKDEKDDFNVESNGRNKPPF